MRVVVDGEVVRRRVGPWTAGVHELLRTLPADVVPQPLSLDDEFETLTCLPGEVGTRPLSADVRSDEALVSVAVLLRRVHDAAPGWCHNDVGPWNVVFESRRAAGLIDWDLAAPGPAASDVASAVWHFAPLYDDAECRRIGWPTVPDRMARAARFCAAYGIALDEALWQAVADRQHWYLEQVLAATADPAVPGAEPWLKVDPADVMADMRWIAEVRAAE